MILATTERFVRMYAAVGGLVATVAVAYGLVARLLVEPEAMDPTSFLLVSLVWPWALLIGLLFALLLLNQGEQIPEGPVAEVYRLLARSWPGQFFGYGAVFAAAGVAAIGVSRRYRRLASRDGRLPEAPRVVVGIGLLAASLLVVIGGLNAVAATAASVSAMEPGTQSFDDPTFNVTVDGPVAELRLTASAPDGTRVTQRLSRRDMRGRVGTAAFPIDYGDSHRRRDSRSDPGSTVCGSPRWPASPSTRRRSPPIPAAPPR